MTAAVLMPLCGCETTSMTTLEEDRGSYQDAREFLRVGATTKAEVLAKYGQPTHVEQTGDREAWHFERLNSILLNAYTNTSLGTDSAILSGQRGYQHTVVRRSRLELFFDRNGTLSHYRIMRDAL